MKKIVLILLCTLIAGNALAFGGVFGRRKVVRNVNGVSSVVVTICRGLLCPEVIIKEGNCDEIEHATQQYGVCICDEGYKVKEGKCVLSSEADCTAPGEKWCTALNNCIDSTDCCTYLSVSECQICDSETGAITDKSEGLCKIGTVTDAGYCFAGECVNPCDLNSVDNCIVSSPISRECVCSECNEGYYLNDGGCELCAPPTESCQITSAVKDTNGCIVKTPFVCPEETPLCGPDNKCVACASGYYNESTRTCTDCLVNYGIDSVGACTDVAGPICNASGTCEACPADEPIYEAGVCKCPANASCENAAWVCNDGYYKSGNSCVPCPGEHTATCDHTGTPLSCKEGYRIIDDQCNPCPDPTETICRGEPAKDAYNCATQVLEDCPSTAPICGTDNKTCKCPANADCTVDPWVCNDGYFKAESTTSTTGDDFVCYPCTIKDSHAATCDDNGDPKTCESGYALADGKCIRTCTSYTENECGSGYYCVFEPFGCVEDKDRGPGLCRPVGYIGKYKSATVNNREYTMSNCQKENCPDWWSAYSWCKALGKTMVSLSELGCSTDTGCSADWTLLRKQLGEAFYDQSTYDQPTWTPWKTWTRDKNACFAHIVELGNDSANNIHSTGEPTGRSQVLCIGSIDS